VSAPAWLRPLLAALESSEVDIFRRRVEPAPAEVRRAAVLVLFGEGPEGPDVLLIEKGPHLRTHAGQPAFPGGGIEPGEDPEDAALREAAEETGLDPGGVEVLACLPELWVPPSGNAVTPVIAWWHRPTEVGAADPREVAAVARVPLSVLADPANRLQIRSPRGNYASPAFRVAGMLVWGFTGGVLDRLLELGGWARPWPQDQIEELPGTLPAMRPTDIDSPFAEGA
jgi:8-oxo-dGTP pyrophosphatase MutT (NUDIX family)